MPHANYSNVCLLFVGVPYSHWQTLSRLIAELAERSPIIIQNSSNPSSRKNLDVRPYKVLLLTCVVNCTTGTPTPRLCPVVSALGSESDDPGSSPGRGKALYP